MSAGSPPLRFLVIVVGGWICGRAVYLGAEWLNRPHEPTAVAARSPTRAVPPNPVPTMVPLSASRTAARLISLEPDRVTRPILFTLLESPAPAQAIVDPPAPASPPAEATVPTLPAFLAPVPAEPAASRWSGSAWLFARQGEERALAAGGTLGGSQAGARLLYRLLDDPALALSSRLYAPLRDTDGAEAALGIDWRPVSAMPVSILAERRKALGRDGRSAFSLLAYGGVSDAPVAGPAHLDFYAQAGAVGVRSRDLFADGSARVTVPLERSARLWAGAGVWGAAQPGTARLDLGPLVSFRLAPRVAVTGEWRFRVAGHAAPASGPALTLSTDF